MKYCIEYEIPPLRAIYRMELAADSEKDARELFAKNKPRGRIRKLESDLEEKKNFK